MRTAIIKISELRDDWRAEAYCPPTAADFEEAKKAGWTCGAKGTTRITSPWATHGNIGVRDAFQAAYEAGIAARKKFLGEE